MECIESKRVLAGVNPSPYPNLHESGVDLKGSRPI